MLTINTLPPGTIVINGAATGSLGLGVEADIGVMIDTTSNMAQFFYAASGAVGIGASAGVQVTYYKNMSIPDVIAANTGSISLSGGQIFRNINLGVGEDISLGGSVNLSPQGYADIIKAVAVGYGLGAGVTASFKTDYKLIGPSFQYAIPSAGGALPPPISIAPTFAPGTDGTPTLTGGSITLGASDNPAQDFGTVVVTAAKPTFFEHLLGVLEDAWDGLTGDGGSASISGPIPSAVLTGAIPAAQAAAANGETGTLGSIQVTGTDASGNQATQTMTLGGAAALTTSSDPSVKSVVTPYSDPAESWTVSGAAGPLALGDDGNVKIPTSDGYLSLNPVTKVLQAIDADGNPTGGSTSAIQITGSGTSDSLQIDGPGNVVLANFDPSKSSLDIQTNLDGSMSIVDKTGNVLSTITLDVPDATVAAIKTETDTSDGVSSTQTTDYTASGTQTSSTTTNVDGNLSGSATSSLLSDAA